MWRSRRKVCDKTCIFFFFPIINKYFLMAKRSLLSRCPSYFPYLSFSYLLHSILKVNLFHCMNYFTQGYAQCSGSHQLLACSRAEQWFVPLLLQPGEVVPCQDLWYNTRHQSVQVQQQLPAVLVTAPQIQHSGDAGLFLLARNLHKSILNQLQTHVYTSL